jgi:HlyD family secretion protein
MGCLSDEEMFMFYKVKIFILILLITLIIGSIAACSSTQTSSPPAGASSVFPGSVPPGQSNPIGGAPGAPGGMPPGQIGPAGQSNNVPSTTPQKVFTAAGTIQVSTYANLYFGSAGQISSINVKQGDYVTKGTILAKLDPLSLEASQAQAKVALNVAKLSQIQANSNLAAAQFSLDKVQPVSDIKDKITDDEWAIKAAQIYFNLDRISGGVNENNKLSDYLGNLENKLYQHQKELADLLSGDVYSGSNALTYNIGGQTYDRLTVEDARIKELALEVARQSVAQSQDVVNLAQKNLDVVQEQLDQAVIKAPFDGQIARVNKNAGDIISAPAALQNPVIYMIDPHSLELVIGVNELDLSKVKTAQKVTVIIDAFPDNKLEGLISAISPVPTLQGSIVDYDVKITLSVPDNLGVRVGMNSNAVIKFE